jgi:hypothetical protein
MKAIATVSMYDMGAAFRNGLNHSQTPEQRKAFIQSAIEQRMAEFKERREGVHSGDRKPTG